MSEIEERRKLLQQIESDRNTKAVLYVTGDRQGLETMIGQDVIARKIHKKGSFLIQVIVL